MHALSQRLSSRVRGAAGSAIQPFTNSTPTIEDVSTLTEADLDSGQKWELLAPGGTFVREQIVVTAVNDGHFSYRKMADPDGFGSMTTDELRELVASDRARLQETVELTA